MSYEYHREGNLIEFIIRDSSGAKLEAHKCNMQDRKRYWKLLKYFKEKYGAEPSVPFPPEWFNQDF